MARKIVKFDGRTEDFDRRKIVDSIMSAGGTRMLAERIASIVEDRLGDRPKATTMHIRRIVLNELGRMDPSVEDSFKYYDRVVKGRITYETGKFYIVRNGEHYTGEIRRRNVKSGVETVDDIRNLIDELKEDILLEGVRMKEAGRRRSKVLIDAIRESQMSEYDKEQAVKLVVDFRRNFLE